MGTLAVTVTPKTPTTFTAISVCQDVAQAFPTTSVEGFTGTWSTPSIDTSAVGTINYIFTPTAGQCAAMGTLAVTVTPKTVPNFNIISTICNGEAAPILSGVSINSINGSWLPSTVSNTVSGSYTFTPLSGQCASAITITITVEDSFDFEIKGECMNNNFMLQVVPLSNSFDVNNVNFNWEYNTLPVGTNSEMFDVVAYFNSTTANEQVPATFYATVTTAAGCVVKHPFIVDRVVCEIQRGISPNNDGDNEYFDLSQMDVSKLNVYNRYGSKVYSKGNYKKEWFGQTDAGNDLPDGTYYYVIEFNNNQDPKTGWIYINREKK